MWLARTVCYSQLNLISDRLLSDSMWFLCRSRHIRYVESGSHRNLIDSLCQHFRANIETQILSQSRIKPTVWKRFREGTFFLGGGGLGNFGIFSQKSVGPPLRFN